MSLQRIDLAEHDRVDLSDENKACLRDVIFKGPPSIRNEKPEHLGIARQCDTLQAHYYIGTTWLKEGVIYASVSPKIQGIDFAKMLNFAEMLSGVLRSENSLKYLSSCYGIMAEEKTIPAEKSDTNYLILLVVLHYISLLKRIAGTGLRKDYVTVEENLKCKIKGKILVPQNIRINNKNSRNDRCFCSYQEYTADIPVNRLLKKALLKAEKMIYGYPEVFEKGGLFHNLRRDIARLKSTFSPISADFSTKDVRNLKFSKLFRNYDDAVKVAKMLLRQESNKAEAGEKGLPPFWIDMTRLFELYVYSLLEEAFPESIKYQVRGRHATVCDFIEIKNRLIIDAKYKTWYNVVNKEHWSSEERTYSPTDDIRELSGYARDTRILHEMTVLEGENYIPPCIIIYPDKNGVERLSKNQSLVEQAEKMDDYVKFYKIGIKLPTY